MVGADDFDLVIWMRKGACQASREVLHVRCSYGASSKDSGRKKDLRTVWIDMSILHSNFMNFLVGKGWSFVGRGDDRGSPEILDGLVNSNVLASYLEFLLSFRSLANENESRWFVSIEEFTGVSDSAFSWNDFETMSLDDVMDDGGSADIRRFWAEHLPILMVVDGDYQFVGLGRTSGVVVHGIEPEFESVTTLADTFDEFLAASMRGQYEGLFFGR